MAERQRIQFDRQIITNMIGKQYVSPEWNWYRTLGIEIAAPDLR